MEKRVEIDRNYQFMYSRGYTNLMSYYIDKDLDIVKRICNGELISPDNVNMMIYSLAVFTKGACLDPTMDSSTVDVGLVATLLDHVSVSPCMFFQPASYPLTRNLKIEFLDNEKEFIQHGELSLCTSKLIKTDGRKFGVETIFYQRGYPFAKATFFGIQPTNGQSNPQSAYDELLERCEKAKSINYGVILAYANEIEKANGDSFVLVEKNKEKMKEFTDEKINQYSNKILSKDDKLEVISGSGINGRRPISGYPAIIHHRVFYNKETMEYSAAAHFSIFTEGAPNRNHGGSTAEMFIGVMIDVADHIAKNSGIEKRTIKVRTIDLDYLKTISLDTVADIPTIKYSVDKNIHNHIFITFKMDLVMDGVVTNKILSGRVDVISSTQQQRSCL